MLKVSPIVFPSSLHTGNEKVYSIIGEKEAFIFVPWRKLRKVTKIGF